MPYAVAAIGVLAFLAGLATANHRWVLAGLLVGTTVSIAWWLRVTHFYERDQAFRKGTEYAATTSERFCELPEATEVSTEFEQMVARVKKKSKSQYPRSLDD